MKPHSFSSTHNTEISEFYHISERQMPSSDSATFWWVLKSCSALSSPTSIYFLVPAFHQNKSFCSLNQANSLIQLMTSPNSLFQRNKQLPTAILHLENYTGECYTGVTLQNYFTKQDSCCDSNETKCIIKKWHFTEQRPITFVLRALQKDFLIWQWQKDDLAGAD